jgi:transcription-repair coupling factor (superfamily II helicase)
VLFKVGALRLRANPLGVRKIEAGPKGVRIEFVDKPNVDPSRIIRLLQSAPRLYRLDGPNKLRIMADMPDAGSRVAALRALIDSLGSG